MRNWKCSVVVGLITVLMCALSLGQDGKAENPSGAIPKQGAATASPAGKPRLTRGGIQRALDKARKSDSRELGAMANSVLAQKDLGTRADLRPDFEALLVDKLPEAQCLGAQGLFALKSPESKQVLIDYLKGKEKNLHALNDLRPGPDSGTEVSLWEIQASAYAVKALGQIGDRSVIPLLESLQDVRVLRLEWGHAPVQEALIKLGSLKSLTRLNAGDGSFKVAQAAVAIRKVRDPNAATDLMSAVRDQTVAEEIRLASLHALGSIKTGRASGFLVTILDDTSIPAPMRRTAAIAAGSSGDISVETSLKRYAEDRSSDVQTDAFMGLVLLQPARYLGQWLEKIMDPHEDARLRTALAGKQSLIPRELLRNEKKRLMDGLDAVRDNGRPFDEVRVEFWLLINEMFHEEPEITLTSRDDEIAISPIRHAVWVRLWRENEGRGRAAVNRQADEIIEKLIHVP